MRRKKLRLTCVICNFIR